MELCVYIKCGRACRGGRFQHVRSPREAVQPRDQDPGPPPPPESPAPPPAPPGCAPGEGAPASPGAIRCSSTLCGALGTPGAALRSQRAVPRFPARAPALPRRRRGHHSDPEVLTGRTRWGLSTSPLTTISPSTPSAPFPAPVQPRLCWSLHFQGFRTQVLTHLEAIFLRVV